MFTILLILFISISSFAQVKFQALSVVVTNLETNQEETISTDVTLKLTDYYLTILDTGKQWKISGDTIRDSDTSFGTYAIDTDNRHKCKIWLRTTNTIYWTITITYSDFELEYRCLYEE
jgi:hypothetical protein